MYSVRLAVGPRRTYERHPWGWVAGRSGFQPDPLRPVRLETWPTSRPTRLRHMA